MLESGRISEGERMPPAVRQNPQRNRRRRDAGKDTGAGVHGEAIGVSNRFLSIAAIGSASVERRQ